MTGRQGVQVMTGIRIAMMVAGLAMAGVVATAWTGAGEATQADAEVLRLREAAWRAWFSGDEAALRRILPADFIGISAEPGPLLTLDMVVEQSQAFRAAGGRLVSLEFPETRFQRDGPVVVLYGRFTAVIEKGGTQKVNQGRLTEMFVTRNGTLVHTGWHLDGVAP